MEVVLDNIVKGLEQALGSGWKVTPHHVFDVVYYFNCEFEGISILTHSYGIYNEVDVDRIIKIESELIKRML